MRKLIVFDIDGTLADIKHRRGYVQTKPKNWKAFEKGIPLDSPNQPVIDMFQAFVDKNDVLLASGRGEQSREVTETWLVNNWVIGWKKLYMRPEGDYRSDVIIKREILDQIVTEWGKKPDFVVDDRKRVCDMWIENGIFVFDVGQGVADF